MVCLPRASLVGVPVHLIQRGNHRQICFVVLEDFSEYRSWLKEYSVKYKVDICAWVLMTNHVHLLYTPQQTGAMSLIMQSVDVGMCSTLIININEAVHSGKGDTNRV